MNKNENRFLRLTPEHHKWHLNAHYPGSPSEGLTACGEATTTPIYENEMKALETNGVVDQCIYCFAAARRKNQGIYGDGPGGEVT